MSIQNEIVRTIEMRAPVATVWSAIVNAQQFAAWFRCTIEGEFTLGEVVNCRSTYEGNEELVWQKLVKAIEPERYFAFVWSPGDTGADLYSDNVGTTLVEFTLTPTASGTQLEIRESGFANLPEAYRAESFRSNTEGWNAQAENISNYVQLNQ